MENSDLSAVQFLNLAMLHAVQQEGRRNPCDACLKFQVTARELTILLALGHKELFELITSVGEITLFPPRADIARVLDFGANNLRVDKHMLRAATQPRRSGAAQ